MAFQVLMNYNSQYPGGLVQQLELHFQTTGESQITHTDLMIEPGFKGKTLKYILR